MIVGLDLALILAASKVRSDSQLVVKQIQREYEARNERMAHYLTSVEAHLDKLVEIESSIFPMKRTEKQMCWSELSLPCQ